MAQKPCAGILEGNAARPFKHLDDDALALHLYDSALPHGAVIHADVDHLFKGSIFYIVQNDQGAVDLLYADII